MFYKKKKKYCPVNLTYSTTVRFQFDFNQLFLYEFTVLSRLEEILIPAEEL